MIRSRIALFALLVSLMGIALTTPVSAQASEEQARARFMEGRSHYDDGEYLEAAEAFREAYELSDRSELLFNIGQAYSRADRLAEAERYYQEYLRLQPNAPNADDVVDRIIEIQQERAARMATVEVTSEPPGASIFVGDASEPQCEAPCSLDLDPGDVVITGRLAGHRDRSTTVHLERSDAQAVRLRLESTTRSGQLLVHTNVSRGQLIAAGNTHRIPSSSPISLPEGPQLVVLESGSARWQETITITADETMNLFVPLDSGPALSPLTMASLGLGGAAVALAGAGALMGLQARETHSYLTQQQALGANAHPDLVQAGRSQQLMANGLWVGSVVFAGAAVGLWVLGNRSPSSPSAEQPIAPTPEPADEGGSGLDLL